RKLDDEDLASGDDEGRTDRVAEEAEEVEAVEQTLNFMDADIARHCIPEPSDGELYAFKVPKFLAFEPTAWNHKTFQPPTTDHHSRGPPSEGFSPFDTAMNTIRWRRSPTNPAQLQSNARLLRWSDGSLTLQFASNPTEQYQINANMLAPPQARPKKPTPISEAAKNKADLKDSHTYLVAPCLEAQVMRVTNKFTSSLSVVPAKSAQDDAVAMLQARLAAAANRTHDDRDQAISFLDVNEDPELQRAREEAAFKERQRQARAKEKHEMKQREKDSRRGGHGRSAGYGLSIGGLEDEEGGRRSGVRKQKPKTGLRRDWSSDEDYGIGRGRTREDSYDEEDDFVVGSDEEPEIVEDDEDPDDGIIEAPSPKRNRAAAADDEDDEVVVSRPKRRRVVEDDDEDE
ncbi:hypothetical protein K491DRAFT_596801, partial [Lophiostoma macrostomum CBS 122681]